MEQSQAVHIMEEEAAVDTVHIHCQHLHTAQGTWEGSAIPVSQTSRGP